MEEREIRSDLIGHKKDTVEEAPIDQGWAWIIMLASFIISFLSMGYVRTFGILYVEYEEKFAATSTMTSSTMGVRSIVESLTALLVHSIVLEFVTIRSVLIFGGFIYSLNLLIKVFAKDMVFVILSECILSGMAQGMVYSPPFVMLGLYFKKHRSFVTSLVTCGSSLGLLAFAPLLNYLLEEEGYQGAHLIYGAILLNLIPCGCLMRPLQPHHMQHDEDTEDFESSDCPEEKTFENLKETSRSVDLLKQLSVSEKFLPNLTAFPEKQLSVSEKCLPTLKSTRPEVRVGSSIEIKGKTKSVGIVLSKMFDLHLFKDSRFLVIMGFTFFGVVGSTIGALLLPPFGKEIGLSHDETSRILMILAVVDLCSRLLLGFIADRNLMKKKNIVFLSLIIIGTTYHCARFCTSYTSFIVFTVIVGMFSGTYYALLTVILIDILGLAKLNTVLGFVSLYSGISSCLTFPIFGVLRDGTGTYIPSYHFVGSCAYASAAILCMEPLASRKYKYKDHVKKEEEFEIVQS